MSKAKTAFALIGLVGLVAANAAAYVNTNIFARAYRDTNIPASYPVLGMFVVAFAGTALLAMMVAPFVASVLTPKKRLAWASVIAASIVLFSFALASGPLSSVDNSWNVLSARNMVVHGRNPYVTTAGTFRNDPAYVAKWSRWYGMPMVYGPLWTALSAIPILLVGDVHAQTKGMLLLNLAGYLLAGGMLYRWLRKRDAQKAWYVLVFWLLNPVAALEIANAGHNEGVMLPFLVMLATALVDENLILAAAGIVGAALIKHWPLALAPALLAIPATNRKRLMTIAGSLAALVLVWLPFWAGPTTFDGIRGIAAYGSEMFFFSPFRFVAASVLLRLNEANTRSILSTLSLIVTLDILAAITYFSLKRKVTPIAAAFILISTYHFVWLSWLQPWYLLAFLPFVAVTLEKTKAVLLMAMLGIVGMLSYTLAPSRTMAVALLFIALYAAVSYAQRKRLENSATTVPQTNRSE